MLIFLICFLFYYLTNLISTFGPWIINESVIKPQTLFDLVRFFVNRIGMVKIITTTITNVINSS